MKNNLRSVVNEYEYAVSPFLFDRIILEHKNRLSRKKRMAWTAIIVTLLLLSASAYYLMSNPIPTPSKMNGLPIAQKSTEQSTQNAQSISHQALTEKTIPAQTDIVNAKTTQPKKYLAKAKPIIRTQAQASSLNAKSLAPRLIISSATPMATNPLSEKKSYSDKIITRKPRKTNHFTITNQLPSLLSLIAPNTPILPPGNDCYSFNGRVKSPSALFIDFLGSPDIVKSTLVAKNKEFNSHKKVRESTEEYLPSFSAQVGIGLRTGQGIVFRTGVNYSQYETKFYKKDKNHKKVTIEQIFDQQGNLLRIDTVTTVGYLEVQHHNKQQFVGIPLTVGYTTAGKKLNIGFNLGAQFNIQKKSSGRYISTDGHITNFTLSSTDPKPIYKTSVGIQGIANLTFAYAIGDYFDIILAPHVKITPNPITETNYILTEKLMTTGVWLGGRVWF